MEDKPKVHIASYALYYSVLFFAHWFGSHRFDVDGDGDFDPEDVEAYLSDRGLISKNFRQTTTKRRKLKRGQSKDMQKSSSSDSQGNAPQSREEQGVDEIDGTIENLVSSKVKKGSSVEDEIVHNLWDRQILPWFIIFECVSVLGLWFVMAMVKASEDNSDPLKMRAGLDSFAEGKTDLRLITGCGSSLEDQRFEAWRWWTYQWTHIGAMHALMNVFLCVMLGVPLEGLHGALRMTFMFNIGVFGGSCMHFANDAHTVVVGCSGGCYALIGMHFADLFVNWRQKKFRWPSLIFISLLVGVDIITYQLSLSSENTSHSAHVGGFIAGLCIGVLVGRNLKVKTWELVLMFFVGILSIALLAFCIVWLVMHEVPKNVWETADGTEAYCWTRQVYNVYIDTERWLCVQCGNQTCIDHWTPFQASLVSASACTAENRWYTGN